MKSDERGIEEREERRGRGRHGRLTLERRERAVITLVTGGYFSLACKED